MERREDDQIGEKICLYWRVVLFKPWMWHRSLHWELNWYKIDDVFFVPWAILYISCIQTAVVLGNFERCTDKKTADCTRYLASTQTSESLPTSPNFSVWWSVTASPRSRTVCRKILLCISLLCILWTRDNWHDRFPVSCSDDIGILWTDDNPYIFSTLPFFCTYYMLSVLEWFPVFGDSIYSFCLQPAILYVYMWYCIWLFIDIYTFFPSPCIILQPIQFTTLIFFKSLALTFFALV